MNPLVSIIIPTYNRGHLIGETLFSIIGQTYKNWECIVIDDGSTDYTPELMEFYCEIDARIKYFRRPVDRPKGANACRNYGFELSQGEFINWFDSDDLMLPENIELKVLAFDDDTDFVIGNTVNFDEKGRQSRPYKIDYNIPITPENVISGIIGWITNDVMIRKNAVPIRFNENLDCGQEYNFFSRFLFYTTKGRYLRKDVAKRRLHNSSIQSFLQNDLEVKNEKYYSNEYHLLNDIADFASSDIKNRSLKRLIRFSYFVTPKFKITRRQTKLFNLLLNHKKYYPVLLYSFWMVSNLVTGKGYIFVQRAHSRLSTIQSQYI